MWVRNEIARCDDGKHRDRGMKPKGIALHRFGLEIARDAFGIATFYRSHPQWTGGHMPYTFVFRPDGIVEQALPISEVGPHARRWSSPYIGCVFLGDFRKHAPSRAQWYCGVDLITELCGWMGHVTIARHDKLPGGSSSLNKECPGPLFDVETFTKDVRDNLVGRSVQNLTQLGVMA